MLLNVVLRFVPRVLTTAMIATEMPAAIRPYSIAVAPLSSVRKHRTSFFIGKTPHGRLLNMVVYFSCEEMLLNVLFSDVPIEFTAATITTEIPAAMRAYSMAVAPALLFTKRRT